MRKYELVFLAWFLSACGSGDSYQKSLLPVDTVNLTTEDRLIPADPGKVGPYKVLSYTPIASDSGYKSAIIYYPSGSFDSLLPATTLSGGFTNTKEQMSWLGKHLASHGIVTIIFTPTTNTAGNAQIWANGHKASVNTLQSENKQARSPLLGKLNIRRIGVAGYSYGGAGAILAANQLPNDVAAALPLCAYQPSKPTSKIPYLFVTGTNDTIASPTLVLNAFKGTMTGQPKAYARFNRLTHFDMINGGNYQESVARYVTAWSLKFLAENDAYSTYINGEMAQKQAADKRVFASASDYIYQE